MKLILAGDLLPLEIQKIEEVANAAFSFFDYNNGEIELKFVTEEEIRLLNKQYRQIDKETDVLSFNISEEPLMGQIFICYNIAKRQADEFDKSIEAEVALLLVHGILHIFGFDHEENSEAKNMEEIEKQILTLVGYKR